MNGSFVAALKDLVKPDLAELYAPNLLTAFEVHQMSEVEQMHFLTQILFESGNLRRTVENMNYSAGRLMKVFRRYFPTIEKANRYAHNPSKIGSLVYANRNGNGSESSGDGYRYRGRGFIQITFRDNYEAFGRWIGRTDILEHPSVVATNHPVESALWYWHERKLGRFATDRGADVEIYKPDLSDITYRVNGSKRSVDERFKLFRKVFTAYWLIEGL